MEYYKIEQERSDKNILIPKYPTMSEIWSDDKPMLLSGSAENEKKEVKLLPFYEGNVRSASFLVSRKLGDIWKKYEISGRYRPCIYGHIESRKLEAYYFMYPKIRNILHEETKYQRDGEIEEICLISEYIGEHRVFGVRGKFRTDIILAGDVLDEMMREGIVGFRIIPVSCV